LHQEWVIRPHQPTDCQHGGPACGPRRANRMTDTPEKPDTPKPKKVKSISLGWAEDTEPIYQGGWNFISGKNLNPNLRTTSAKEVRHAVQDGERGGVSASDRRNW